MKNKTAGFLITKELLAYRSRSIGANVLRLCVVVDFEALNCQPTTKVDLKN